MMRPNELKLKSNVLKTFENMVETYERMIKIRSVSLYYDNHPVTSHGNVQEGDVVATVVRRALIDHWRNKLVLEASNVRSHGIDPTSLMPKDIVT